MSTSSLQYQCQRCGNCCRWPGEVVLSEADIVAMADFLEVTVNEFTEQFTVLRSSRQGLALKQNADNSCVFLNSINECRVQKAKPAQCSAFPNAWRFPGWRQICEATPVAPTLPT